METKKRPSDLSAVDLIKYLNGRRNWHGKQYRSLCGEWLRKADTATPAKGSGSHPSDCSECDALRLEIATLNAKYQEVWTAYREGRPICRDEMWKKIQDLPVVMPRSPSAPDPMVKLRDLHGIFSPNVKGESPLPENAESIQPESKP